MVVVTGVELTVLGWSARAKLDANVALDESHSGEKSDYFAAPQQ